MKVEVLGSMQDGGLPHMDCSCDLCEAAREDPRKQRYMSSILLKEDDTEDTIKYLVEATPDIRHQIKGDYLDGVFLTHTHIGHIQGLPFFGYESADMDELSVYCTEDVKHYIRTNDPLRMLVDRKNIQIHEMEDSSMEDLRGGEIEAQEIEHRTANTDTLAFMVKGDSKKLYYASDHDELTEDIIDSIQEADIAIINGCFWTPEELGRTGELSQPMIKNMIDVLEEVDTDVYFTHLNHTNPVLREESEEREELEERGFGIVEKGMTFDI